MADAISFRGGSVRRPAVLNDSRKPLDVVIPVWDSAKCNYHPNPDWFFDDLEANRGVEQKKFCSDCPVKQKCLDYALRVNVSGIWGGTTLKERQAIRKELNITPHIFSFTMIDAYRSRGKDIE